MTDQSYGEATLEALGRNFASVFLAMVNNGMTRYEALEVLKAWVASAATPKPEQGADR